MLKQIAILCLAIFFFALFVASTHDHGTAGLPCDCAICITSFLSLVFANNTAHIYHLGTRSIGPSLATIILPVAFLARLDARAPPA